MEVDDLRRQVKQHVEVVQEEYLLEEILKRIDFESDKEGVLLFLPSIRENCK